MVHPGTSSTCFIDHLYYRFGLVREMTPQNSLTGQPMSEYINYPIPAAQQDRTPPGSGDIDHVYHEIPANNIYDSIPCDSDSGKSATEDSEHTTENTSKYVTEMIDEVLVESDNVVSKDDVNAYAKVDINKKQRKMNNSIERTEDLNEDNLATIEVSHSDNVTVTSAKDKCTVHNAMGDDDIYWLENDLYDTNNVQENAYQGSDMVENDLYDAGVEGDSEEESYNQRDLIGGRQDIVVLEDLGLYDSIHSRDDVSDENNDGISDHSPKAKFLSLRRQKERIQDLQHVASFMLWNKKSSKLTSTNLQPALSGSTDELSIDEIISLTKTKKKSKKFGFLKRRFSKKKEDVPIVQNDIYQSTPRNSITGDSCMNDMMQLGMGQSEHQITTQEYNATAFHGTVYLSYMPSESTA